MDKKHDSLWGVAGMEETKMDSGCIVCGMQAAGGCMSAHFPNGPYDLELLKNTTWFGSCCNTATSAGYFLACLQTYDPSTSLHNNIFCTDHGKQTLFNSCGIRQGKVLLYGIYHILKGISETGFSILRIWKVPFGVGFELRMRPCSIYSAHFWFLNYVQRR
jgi:hypothetical protein